MAAKKETYQKKIQRLEKQVAHLTQQLETLRECEEKFVFLAEISPDAIYQMDDKGVFTYASPSMERVLGVPSQSIVGHSFEEFVAEEDMEKALSLFENNIAGQTIRLEELKIFRGNGPAFSLEISAAPILRNGKVTGLQGIGRDITERKTVKRDLLSKDIEIEMKNRELEETNEALRTLIKQKERDSDKVLRQILENVNEFVTPYIADLKSTDLDHKQKLYVNVLEANLSEITAPFASTLEETCGHLTDREIEVANLIRMGKTSKQIAELLGTTKRAVDFHRNGLREKLGIKNKPHNLKLFLRSLEENK